MRFLSRERKAPIPAVHVQWSPKSCSLFARLFVSLLKSIRWKARSRLPLFSLVGSRKSYMVFVTFPLRSKATGKGFMISCSSWRRYKWAVASAGFTQLSTRPLSYLCFRPVQSLITTLLAGATLNLHYHVQSSIQRQRPMSRSLCGCRSIQLPRQSYSQCRG